MTNSECFIVKSIFSISTEAVRGKTMEKFWCYLRFMSEVDVHDTAHDCALCCSGEQVLFYESFRHFSVNKAEISVLSTMELRNLGMGFDDC